MDTLSKVAAPSPTPSGLARPEVAHHQRAVTVLRLLEVACIAVPIVMLIAGGQMYWQQQRQVASAQTARLVDLFYESTSKLFDAQRLALEQVRLTVEPMDDAAIAVDNRALHDRLAAMLHFLPHLRDLYVVDRHGHGLVMGT